MSQNPQDQKPQNPPAAAQKPAASAKPKEKIVPKAHHSIVIDMPMVRDYSTGGGHGPEDVLVEGDDKIVTKKWQGYPPKDLNLVGKALPPLPEEEAMLFLPD